MVSKLRQTQPIAPASAAHINLLLDEALEETFPASDPIAISEVVLSNPPHSAVTQRTKERVP